MVRCQDCGYDCLIYGDKVCSVCGSQNIMVIPGSPLDWTPSTEIERTWKRISTTENERD